MQDIHREGPLTSVQRRSHIDARLHETERVRQVSSGVGPQVFLVRSGKHVARHHKRVALVGAPKRAPGRLPDGTLAPHLALIRSIGRRVRQKGLIRVKIGFLE